MLFSTWQFILLFLPVSFFVYFWLNRRRMVLAGKVWLVAASLFFYAYWDISYLPLMLASILLNFALGTGLAKAHPKFQYSAPARHRKFNKKKRFFQTPMPSPAYSNYQIKQQSLTMTPDQKSRKSETRKSLRPKNYFFDCR